MAKPEEIDDLDALIDKAVDTFFVEAPTEDEQTFMLEGPGPSGATPEPPSSEATGPSLDEAMESLFSSGFQEALSEKTPTIIVSSGDDETDRAIDLAVDTLFVEEPETPAPETTRLEVSVADISLDDEPEPVPPRREEPAVRQPAARSRPEKEAGKQGKYDDVMAQEIERHMRSIYTEPVPPTPPPKPAAPVLPKRAPVTPTPPAPPEPPALARPVPKKVQPQVPRRPAAPLPEPPLARLTEPSPMPKPGESPVRKLQEAILTLEWEISKRSIAVLTSELKKLRVKFQDDVTVDFAAVAMKLVLEYLAHRMSRAHPESIRFLLEVTDLLDRSVGVTGSDPLGVFHRILTRYETFKSVVRKAEGLPDRRPPIQDLGIEDPQAFAKLVEAQAVMLIKASRSLAKGIGRSRDPKNLIRSFRFLVNRSVNRILESTHKDKDSVKKETRKKGNPTPSAFQ